MRRGRLAPRSLRSLVFSAALASPWLAGCGVGLPVATAGDAARAGLQLADLQQGRSLVAARCGSCHRPPQPAEHRISEWPRMLDEMATRSHLDTAERHLVEQYVVTMATR